MPERKRKNIVKQLDTIFSIYIRKRKSKNNIAECYTCGKKDHYKNLQCGHFISRKHYATRWNETNCQVQCYACNVARYGVQFKFGMFLNAEYGKNVAEQLLLESKQVVKYSNSDLIEKIEHYKKLVN